MAQPAEEGNNIQNGWFSESEAMWPGQRFSLEVAKSKEDGTLKVLHHERSGFQDVLVFESTQYGRVLVLDGVIQLTERDEHAYQEMIVHLPMFSHRAPRNVLIVGGGDGGVLREVCRHDTVQHVTMCEIDPVVVQVAKEFFAGSTATAFNDPRLNLVHEDAAEYLKREDLRHKFDVIIVDSSDPVGPAEALFQPEFYSTMKSVLAPGGVISTQGECMWLHLKLISDVITSCSDLFGTVEYAFTTIPTYPSGQIGFILCSDDTRDGAVRLPARRPSAELQAKLKYYNPPIHRAAFHLPQFAFQAIEEARAKAGRPQRKLEEVPYPDGGCAIS